MAGLHPNGTERILFSCPGRGPTAVFGSESPCFTHPTSLSSREKWDCADICCWEVLGLSTIPSHCSVGKSFRCLGWVKVITPEISGACFPTTHSALYNVRTAQQQENLQRPFRIWAGQKVARGKNREISLRLRACHSSLSPLHAFKFGLPGSQTKVPVKQTPKPTLFYTAIHKEVRWCFDNVVWFYHPIPKLSLLNNSEESKYNNLMVEPAQMKFSKAPKSIFKYQFLTSYILRGFLRGCVKVCTSASCTLASTPN